MADTKRCFKCGKVKPTSEFYKDKSRYDGLEYKCKACRKDYGHSYQKTHRAESVKRISRWRKSLPDPDIYCKQYKKRHPDRARAKDAVKYAVKMGRLPKVTTLQCAKCRNRPAAHYHHHNGYAKEHRLDVTPLCPVCHKAVHKD